MVNGIYYITGWDEAGRWLDTAEAVLRGGAKTIQFRAKGLANDRQVEAIGRLLPLCRENSALLIVNDDPLLAQRCDADGVHIGQQDGSIEAARAVLGPGKLIGISTRTVEQVRQADSAGADYIAVGAMFPTATKQDAELVGPTRLTEVRQVTRRPLVAIGGINCRNGGQLIDAGADGLAVISAVADDPQPLLATRELGLLFNRRQPKPHGRMLSIAGSDSGGGAGIQADLKTSALLGGYGMTAITALTAQNTLGVHDVQAVDPSFVTAQIQAVLDDIGLDVIKTGMLFSPDVVREVGKLLKKFGLLAVIDPVMVAKGGAPLLQNEAVQALREDILPHTYLLTPNLPEAEVLTGQKCTTEADMITAAHDLTSMGVRNVLLKGGHLEGDAIDILLAGKELHRFKAPRSMTRNTHGTGCSYAAAIATLLAQGIPLVEAVQRSKLFIQTAISQATELGQGHGPINHWQGAKAVFDSETQDKLKQVT
ncbi:MAG: phosphomethylpyrimidine kinase [Desulfuromonas sp.]|nr:MAG: phosphomethylpyrimidine kinase [Desulfuromonas sp.]